MQIFFPDSPLCCTIGNENSYKKEQWWKNKLTAETAFIYFTEFGEKKKQNRDRNNLQPSSSDCKTGGAKYTLYLAPCHHTTVVLIFLFPSPSNHAQLCWNVNRW